MVTAPFKKNQRFSTDQVVEMCNRGLPEESKISRTIVNKWVQSGLLARQKDDATGDVSYSFLELVKAKVAASLRASKKAEGTGKERTGKAIRLAVERLGKLLARAERASGENGRSKYSDITIFTEGVRVVFETNGYRMDGKTGQLLFRFENRTDSIPDEEGIGWVASEARGA